MATRTSNKEASTYVDNKEAFIGSNTWGAWMGDSLYVVYSYGHHFPMYVWGDGMWMANKDKYSRSTSKHQSQLRPRGLINKQLDTASIKELVSAGSVTEWTIQKAQI
jgi:hypothetical protein